MSHYTDVTLEWVTIYLHMRVCCRDKVYVFLAL